jgi:hypothetical protein
MPQTVWTGCKMPTAPVEPILPLHEALGPASLEKACGSILIKSPSPNTLFQWMLPDPACFDTLGSPPVKHGERMTAAAFLEKKD